MNELFGSKEELAAARAAMRNRVVGGEEGGGGGGVVALSEQEELLLESFYLQQLQLTNKSRIHLPLRAQATASLFFRRFFLRRSPVEFHPQHVILTALFLASKVEECRMDAASVCRKAQFPSWTDDVLRIEVPMLQALDFKIMVDHPHVAARGWLSVLREANPAVDITNLDRVDENVNWLMTTDASLLYSAAHVAAGAAWNVLEDETLRTTARTIFEGQGVPASTLDALTVMLREGSVPITADKVSGVMKKLKAWVKAREKLEKDNKKKAGKLDAKKKAAGKKKKASGAKRVKTDEEMGGAVAADNLAEAAAGITSQLGEDDPGDFMIQTNIKRVRFKE